MAIAVAIYRFDIDRVGLTRTIDPERFYPILDEALLTFRARFSPPQPDPVGRGSGIERRWRATTRYQRHRLEA